MGLLVKALNMNLRLEGFCYGGMKSPKLYCKFMAKSNVSNISIEILNISIIYLKSLSYVNSLNDDIMGIAIRREV